jgi:hypothetical protein
MSNVQVGRVFGVSTFVNCQRLHGPIQAFKTQAIVLAPDTRTTWILDIGHWILDIHKNIVFMPFQSCDFRFLSGSRVERASAKSQVAP